MGNSEAEDFQIGEWKGSPSSSPNDGCSMVKLVSGETFLVAHLTRARVFSLGMYNQGWAYSEGWTTSGQVLVDQAPPLAVEGRATSPDTLMFSSGREGLLRWLFETGTILRLESGDAWIEVGLRGSRVAAAKLEQCVLTSGAALHASTSPGGEPSFDCSNATHADEATICADSRLSELDQAASIAYGQAKRATGTPRALRIARQGLVLRADCGTDKVCILDDQVALIVQYQLLEVPRKPYRLGQVHTGHSFAPAYWQTIPQS